MSISVRSDVNVTPIVTFIVIITLGIILAVYVNEEEGMRLPIILVSFVLGMTIAILEFRTIISKSNTNQRAEEIIMSKEEKLARYVADLFDEDIPFDEIDNNKSTRKSK